MWLAAPTARRRGEQGNPAEVGLGQYAGLLDQKIADGRSDRYSVRLFSETDGHQC